MNPKIVSVGFAVPVMAHSQRESFSALGYPHQFWPIFRDADIQKRHFFVAPNDANKKSWQELCELYKEGALLLSREAVKSCLDSNDRSQIGCITFASCTGYQCPAMSYLIAADLGLPNDMEHTDIVGDGCQGAAPALKRAYDYTKLTGKQSLAVSTEICSAAYYPEPDGQAVREGEYELLRAKAIFADGSAAVLVGYDSDPRHPELVDFANNFDPRYVGHLGFRWVDGRLWVVLSREVPRIAPTVIAPAIFPLLERHNLKISDIKWFICHPGGKAIMNSIRDKLGFTEEQMALSRETMRQFGNTSSATIGIMSKLLMSKDVRPGDWGLMMTMGAGFAVVAALFRFPAE